MTRRGAYAPLPILALVVAMISVQGGASLAKGLFPAVGAQGAVTLRLVFAAVMMLALWRPWRASVARGRWASIGAYGVVLGAMNLLFYLSLRTVPLGIAVALEFTGPLAVALLGSRRPLDFLWVAFAVIGVGLLLPLRGGPAPVDPRGLLLALGAGVCWALYIVFGQKAGAGGSGQAVGYGTCIAALVAAPFGIAHAGMHLLSPALLVLGLMVALLGSVIPYSLEMVALSRLPAKTFGILMSAEPAIGVVLGFLVLGERLGPLQIVAVLTIIVASAGAVVTQRRSDASTLPWPAD